MAVTEKLQKDREDDSNAAKTEFENSGCSWKQNARRNLTFPSEFGSLCQLKWYFPPKKIRLEITNRTHVIFITFFMFLHELFV